MPTLIHIAEPEYILLGIKQLDRIDDDTVERLDKVAPARSRQRSAFIRAAIQRALWEIEERRTREATRAGPTPRRMPTWPGRAGGEEPRTARASAPPVKQYEIRGRICRSRSDDADSAPHANVGVPVPRQGRVAEVTTTVRGIPQEMFLSSPRGAGTDAVANLTTFRVSQPPGGVIACRRRASPRSQRALGYASDWPELKASEYSSPPPSGNMPAIRREPRESPPGGIMINAPTAATADCSAGDHE